MMSLEENLTLSKIAISNAKQIVTLGSNNLKEDKHQPERQSASWAAQVRIFEDIDENASNRRRAKREGVIINFTFLDSVRETIDLVKTFKAGNCAYQAYIAFEFLLANSLIRPISICSILDNNNVAKHTMVLIGNPDNADAVICDPHQSQSYPLSAFFEKVYEGIPIRAYEYGEVLAMQFIRYSAVALNIDAADDKEYKPLLPISSPQIKPNVISTTIRM